MISKRAFETKCEESNNNTKQKRIAPPTITKVSKQQTIALAPNRTTTSTTTTTTTATAMQSRQVKDKEVAGRQQAASNSSCMSKPLAPPTTTLMMDTRRGPSTTAECVNSNRQEQQQKLIKKAFVRFEDYLDLNEENMRRSCKKLMNHLYSEPKTSVTSAVPFTPGAEATAPAISCQLQTVPTNDQCHTSRQSTGAPNGNESVAASDLMIPASATVVSASMETQLYQPSATNGKSYLRSQYERRHLRQIQLVNKVQQEKVRMFEHVNGGAKVGLDQQDIVERSHELSKRRFFEKLERRGSMKNSNLNSTQTHEQQQAANRKPTDDQERKRLQDASKQKRAAAAAVSTATTANSNENELLLKVYQPIKLKGNISEEDRNGQEAKNSTLGGLDEPQAETCCDNKELAGELIGFHTPSLQSPAAAGEQERLIEIPDEQIMQGQQQQQQQSEQTISKNATLVRLVESGVGRSAFEIKVPPLSAFFDLSNQPDGFISSGLLVVKQVKQAATDSGSLLQVADDSAGLPNLSRRATGKATAQLASNKAKTPLVESTDNKAFSTPTEQINGQMTDTKTMVSARVLASDQSKLAASKLTDSDNQYQAVGISSTISCGNNNTEMETISSVEAEETTSQVESGTSERSAGQHSEQKPAIEFGGASNQVEDHDAPETAIHVGQPGGADGNFAAATTSAITNICSSHPARTQSAAQMQQQQVVGPQTTITKAEIRDVLPKATNEINRVEAIVSAEKNSTEKVTSVGEQRTNEVQQWQQQQQCRALHEAFTFKNISEYVNPAAGANEMHQVDNVNHDASGVKTIAGNIDLIGGDSNLIESSARHSKLVQKKSSTSSSLEEDGSSCSSSGCGASVSVAGSSDGCSASINVAVGPKHELGDFQRPISQGNKSHNEPECNPLYDNVRVSHWPRSQRANEYPDYKQLVGPDQVYPSKNMTLVENHCYASVVIRSDSTPLDANMSASPEREFGGGGYANLLRNKAPPVEYATIHSIDEKRNKKRLQNSYSDTSLSNHSYSTSTANSGGFSALPPAQVDCLAAKNCESSVSLADAQERKSSLFKRFGSLVSKAFNSTTAQSVTPKINESSAPDCPPLQQMEKSGSTNSCCNSKPALVIEKDLQVIEKERERAQLDKADLVILPTKHVNQRMQPQIQQQGKNPTAVLRHDDRLSRGRKHSRQVEHIDSSSTTSNSCSSYSSSPSYDVRHHTERPKRTDSLSDELESLVSRSECSTNYRIQESKLFRKRASSSSKNQPTKAGRRIDIDCVSPTKNADKRSQPFDNRESSNSPRSLLRLFSSSSSQRAAESTPNLTDSLSRRRHSTQLQSEIGANNHGYVDGQQPQPASGFWGLSNLMSNNHATKGESSANEIATSKANRKSRTTKVGSKPEAEDRDYPMYASLQPYAAGYRLHSSSALPREQGQQTLDKYQSLSLYQNLLRNYAKRRHRHHGHGHHHHHHNHHRAHHHSLHRHAHHPVRCAQSCGQNCNLSSSSTSLSYGSNEKFVVWGQLIKINKSDGSQVIELERSPGKPWGFFVARGAINNTKGVFISRMHDNVTSDSLTGLLSIGDRILAIDECPIEPDYDILRVNQLISKKSKILLTVKPFKG